MINNILTGGFGSIEQAASSIKQNNQDGVASNGASLSFQEVLAQKKNHAQTIEAKEEQNVRFSKHADARLHERDIILTKEQLERLNEGTEKAGLKGIKESLVLMDDLAFIVNTQKKVVVTAMDKNFNDENIFTNIDGAVII